MTTRPEIVVKVTPRQFAAVRKIMIRAEPVYGVTDYAASVEALRSLGVEPQDNVTYRFEVVPE